MNIQPESTADEEALAPLLREHYARELGDTPAGMQLWPAIAERISGETRATSPTFPPHRGRGANEMHNGAAVVSHLGRSDVPRSGDRWRAVAAVLAASLVVAMSIAVFSLATPQQGAHSTQPAATTTISGPVNPAALIPAGTLISQIQMLSPTDGWAVGSKDYQNTALVLHYTAGQWHVAATFPGGRLEHLTMLSPTNGWAAGIMMSSIGGGHSHPSLLVRYSDGKWVQVPPPLPDTADLHMLTPDIGYLVGSGPNASGTGPQDHLALYDHGTWHEVPLPTDLFPITLTSLTEGWGLGDNAQLWRFHAGAWSPSGQSLPEASLWGDIQMLSPADGWAAGFNQTGQVTTKGVTIPGWPYLEHYDGTTWQRVAVPAGLPANTALNQIAMESPDAGWAFGIQNNTVPAVLLRYSAGRWSVVPLSQQVSNGVDTISSASSTEAWAAGDRSGDCICSMLLHQKDGVWTAYAV